METNVETFMAQCLTCQKLKIQHQRLAGMLQHLEILGVEVRLYIYGFHCGSTSYLG